MLDRSHNQRGVTMIELIVGMVIIGILIAVGAPSFNQWIQNSHVRTAAQSIVDGLQLARAEAVRRNSQVRFNLSNAAGLVDWDVCSIASSPCPAANIIQSRSNTEGSVNARVGVYNENDGQAHTNYATAITVANLLPSRVTFNGLGQVATTTNCSDPEISRIDVTNAAYSAAAWRAIVVSCPGGQIRMCDPSLPSSDPRGC